MFRTDGEGHVGNMFSNGDPGALQEASECRADWLNDKQEELCKMVEAYGETLSKANDHQLNDLIYSPYVYFEVGPAATYTPTIRKKAGVASVVRIGTGRYTITFSTNFDSAYYAVFTDVTDALTFRQIFAHSRAVGTVDISVVDAAGAAVDIPNGFVSVECRGIQAY